MRVFSLFFTVATLLILSISGCKKAEGPTQPNNPPAGTCNFTTDVISVGGVTNNVFKRNCRVVGGYIAEFLIDTSAAPTGVAVVFSSSTTSTPDSGDYTIVGDPGSIGAGQVYVEYYDASTAWHGTTGMLKVTASGTQRVYTFCNVELTATPTDKKTVSLRGTCD